MAGAGGLIQLICYPTKKDKFCITNDYQTIDVEKQQNSMIIPRNGDILSDIYIILSVEKLTKKPWKMLQNIRFIFSHNESCSQRTIDIPYKLIKHYYNAKNINFDQLIVRNNEYYQIIIPISSPIMDSITLSLLNISNMELQIDYNRFNIMNENHIDRTDDTDHLDDLDNYKIFIKYLPNEIIKLIFNFLDEYDWIRLYKTCKKIRLIFNQQELDEFSERYAKYINNNTKLELLVNYHYLNTEERRFVHDLTDDEKMNNDNIDKALNLVDGEDIKLFNGIYNFVDFMKII